MNSRFLRTPDQRTNGWTDGWTKPLIELPFATKKLAKETIELLIDQRMDRQTLSQSKIKRCEGASKKLQKQVEMHDYDFDNNILPDL